MVVMMLVVMRRNRARIRMVAVSMAVMRMVVRVWMRILL